MRWTPGRRSRNLEDRRAETARGGSRGRLRIPLPRGRGGRAPRMSLGGLLLLLALAWFMGGDLLQVLAGAGGGGIEVPMPMPGGDRAPGSPGAPGAGPVGSPDEERLVDFVSFVLDDLQTSWSSALPGYRDAKLVLFRDAVRSGCGFAAASSRVFAATTCCGAATRGWGRPRSGAVAGATRCGWPWTAVVSAGRRTWGRCDPGAGAVGAAAKRARRRRRETSKSFLRAVRR